MSSHFHVREEFDAVLNQKTTLLWQSKFLYIYILIPSLQIELSQYHSNVGSSRVLLSTFAAGFCFLDFTTGDVLYLAGTTKVHIKSPYVIQ